jgi:hypothetical protein
VLDTTGPDLTGALVVAHLAQDEPDENAALVCELYLTDATRGRCREVNPQDLQEIPCTPTGSKSPRCKTFVASLSDSAGRRYSLCAVPSASSFPELRWTRSRRSGEEPLEVVTLRELLACVEDYEPARALTANALAQCVEDESISTVCLTSEFSRVECSPIVLNRRLREAVLHRVAQEKDTMSEIAIRCGRRKRDKRGNISGETSWLSRRIGQRPEGGADSPSPWVHTDVLALIAREGLGLSPHEVEL